MRIVILIFTVAVFAISCGSGSQAYKIEEVKIHMDNGRWDKALEILADLDNSNEVYRLRAGCYGGKAGLSVIQMGLKFIGKDEGSEGSSDFFGFLESIGISEHVMCGSEKCIREAIQEIGNVSPMLPGDYFIRAFFRLFKSAVNFLSITNVTELTLTDVLNAATEKAKLSCFINTLQIEITSIQSDLDNAGIVSGDTFFDSVDEMFQNLTHCQGYTGASTANHTLCAGSKEDGSIAGCKWACSQAYITEEAIAPGTYNDPGTTMFNGVHPDENGTETLCLAGGVVAGALNWGTITQPANFALITGSEAIGGLLQNIGSGE